MRSFLVFLSSHVPAVVGAAAGVALLGGIAIGGSLARNDGSATTTTTSVAPVTATVPTPTAAPKPTATPKPTTTTLMPRLTTTEPATEPPTEPPTEPDTVVPDTLVPDEGLDVTTLLDQPVDAAIVGDVMRSYGCSAWTGIAAPGGLVPGNGTDCQSGGLGFAVSTALKISDVRMYGPDNPDGFSEFTGPLPLGLEWGMSRMDVVDALTQQYGEPVNSFEPSGKYTNYYQVDFAVDDEPFQGIQLEFNADTEELQGVTINRDPPMKW